MESTQPQRISAAKFAPVNDKSATPFSQQTMVLTKQDYIELKWEANYWRGQKPRAGEGGAGPTAKKETLEGADRGPTQRLYGTKREKTAGPEHAGGTQPVVSPPPRG